MLSNQVLNQLHNEFNLANDIEYSGVLIGENTIYKSINVQDTGAYLNNYILVFNKDSYEIDMWCVSLEKNTFETQIDYMYNLQDCMNIEYANRKPILDWIYESLTYDNIIDCVERLIK